MFAQHSVLDYHVYGLQVCMDVMWTDFFCMDFMCINQLCLKFLCTTFKCINLTECFQAPFLVTYPTMHLQDLNNIWTSYSCQKEYLFTDIHHLKTIVIRVYSTPVSTNHIGTSLFNHNRGILRPIQTWCPIPDQFWHFGPDPDHVRNSGPFWTHWEFWLTFLELIFPDHGKVTYSLKRSL